MLYPLLRALLFRLAPERAHGLALGLLRGASALAPGRWLLRRLYGAPPCRPVQAFGLTFQNPLGLAAGYDKDGVAWRGLACLGFGHLELGTVTPRPQPGNPRPRLFRLPGDRALINRMGFPGGGAEALARRLTGPRPPGLVLGVNLGKQKDTPLEQAAGDYLALMDRFAPLADYLTVNVSSPNTPELRRLQGREHLEELLRALDQKRRDLAAHQGAGRPVPLLVKLAPDLTDGELDDALEAVTRAGMDGVIATNTTVARPALRSPSATETGGLSGAPLHAASLRFVAEVHRRTGGRLPVVGVGGVMDAGGARAMLDAGAALVQVYTGLVYAGPALVREILKKL